MKSKLIVLMLLLSALTQNFAATKPPLVCQNDTPENFVNTCTPDAVFRVAMQDGTNLDDLNLGNLLPISLFDTKARKIIKIVNTSISPAISVAYYGISNPAATGGAQLKLMVQITSWPNSSAVGISQLLSKGSPITGFTENVFYNYSPENNIANTCKTDLSKSTDNLPVLNCPPVSTSTSPSLVTSAVAPLDLLALPAPTKGNLGKINQLLNPPIPLYLSGFGVAVNMNLYKALQAANQSKGLIPSSCVVGDTSTAACQPLLNSPTISGLFAKQGSVRSTNDLIKGNTTPLLVNVYKDISSTQAATGIFFLNTPCGNEMRANASGFDKLDFITPSDSTSSLVIQSKASHAEVVNSLNDAQSGYAIGVLPLSVVPSSNDKWNYIRINNQSPNFSPSGNYDEKNRVGISSGNYGFATTSFAVSAFGDNPIVRAFISALQNISNTDLTGVAYLDGSGTDLSGKQSAVSRLKSNNCSPLLAMNKGLSFQLNGNVSYKNDTETVTTRYADGTASQIVKKAVGTPEVTWANDHITKTTTYTFPDGSKNSVVSSVLPTSVTTYPLDKQTIVTTYADGYATTQTNSSTSTVITWDTDRETKTTTYTFANGGSTKYTNKVPGQRVAGTTSYNVDKETYKKHYFDGKADATITTTGNGVESYSSDYLTKTVVYTFSDFDGVTTNQVNYQAVGAPAVVPQGFTKDSYTINTTVKYSDGPTPKIFTKSVSKEFTNTSYIADKQNITVVYVDGVVKTFTNTSTSNETATLEDGTIVKRYLFADGTFNDVVQ
jgi:hypothetical protein